MKDERKCACCENIITSEDYYEVDGKFYCKDCMGVCHNCDSLELYDNMILVNLSSSSQAYVCSDCIDDTDDFFYCEDCEEYYSSNMLWGRYEGEPICELCSSNYEVCECCHTTIARRDAYFCERTEEYLCFECYENRKSSVQDLLHEYSYKPVPVFYKCEDESDDNNYGYLGVELECDVNDEYDEEKVYDAIESIKETYEDRLYLKRDSSLSDMGVENVSHPCTLNYHMNEFGWDDILNTLIAGTLKGHMAGNSGLHVHIDRRYFGETQEIQDLNIAKLMLIMSKFYNSHIIKFSRRTEETLRWCTDVGLTMDSTDNEYTVIDKMKKCKDRGRYQLLKFMQSENSGI